MTDLTQDYKDGKLAYGWYYVRLDDKSADIAFYDGFFWSGVNPCDIEKILAEVPDYFDWQNMWNTADMEHKANNRLLEDVERLEKENKGLEQTIESQKQTNLVLLRKAREMADKFIKAHMALCIIANTYNSNFNARKYAQDALEMNG